MLLLLASAIVAVAAVLAAAVHVVVRTRELMRRFRTFGTAVEDALAPITAASDELSARAEALDPGELESAFARLSVSRAKLAVLLDAVGETRAGLASITELRPQK